MKRITLTSLAAELDMSRSALRKAVVNTLKIQPSKVRTRQSLGQATLAVTEEEAEIIRRHYSWRLEPEM